MFKCLVALFYWEVLKLDAIFVVVGIVDLFSCSVCNSGQEFMLP